MFVASLGHAQRHSTVASCYVLLIQSSCLVWHACTEKSYSLVACQISRAILGQDQKLRLPKFLEEEEKSPEATKQVSSGEADCDRLMLTVAMQVSKLRSKLSGVPSLLSSSLCSSDCRLRLCIYTRHTSALPEATVTGHRVTLFSKLTIGDLACHRYVYAGFGRQDCPVEFCH